jgi:hypothetical protein
MASVGAILGFELYKGLPDSCEQGIWLAGRLALPTLPC